MANSITDWSLLQGLLASHLIVQDKCRGIRPIGVGEVLRIVIGKSLCLIICEDAEAVCGSAQLCAGTRCGVQGAIHMVSGMFNSNDYGVLVMDAQNALNSINRIALIWNIHRCMCSVAKSL